MQQISEAGYIEMSAEAHAMVNTLGDEIGAKYFRRDAFEAMMRPSYETREARTRLPETDESGALLVYRNPPEDNLYGANHVFTFTPAHYDRVILYVHGGAYVHKAAYVHAQTCDLLSAELNAKVYMPLYTLAPQGTWADAYALLSAVWKDILAEGKPVVTMGDSAGGGLALGFTEQLAEDGTVLPQKLVLFSPWMDVTMSDPSIPDFEDRDVSLAVYGLIECGKMWAAGLDRKDRHVSPIHYDHWEKLPETLLFTGDAEIFYPDVTHLCRLMREAGLKTRLVVGKGLFHVFPVYTAIPESTESRDMIRQFVLG